MARADPGGDKPVSVAEFAPAKINLTLHVLGRRPSGYHDLDSLVVFVGCGDRLTAMRSDAMGLTIDGPMAGGLAADEGNLVLRAAHHLGGGPSHLHLTKTLPLASGIGGGSSDAAAAIRALCVLHGRALPDAASLAALGADVPVCLSPRPQRMAGLGERVAPVGGLPDFWLVLVNPSVALPTPAVFAARVARDAAPMPHTLPRWPDLASLAAFLHTQRNDLESAALSLAPQVGAALAALSGQAHCAFARMSGSGATCFGLFPDAATARAAAAVIARHQPAWWVTAAPCLK
jgi:4-diphosphocytidyl-2-C-methyl-D-erythritol kinase